MNSTGISQFNQARIEWAIRLRYSPMPKLDMELLATELNAFRIGELRTVGKTWEVMMERDGELAINSEKRKSDSACLEWQISSDGSPDGDKHAAALQYFYDNLTATKALDQDATGSVDELVFQTLSAVDYYYSAHEILLRIDNPAAKEVTAEFRHTPLWFFEARRGYLGYLKHIFDMYGQPCIAGEWLTAVNTGWMRQLTMPYCAKWMSIRDWLLFGERYGSGFLEAITDATKDSQEWNDAQTVLNVLANDGLVLHNKGVELKFLEQASRNELPFQPIVELIDRLYAKCYRGVDLATGSRAGDGAVGGGRVGGRNAVGASVQKEESGILLVRDAKWITGVFNDRIDRPILRYLFNEEPRAWFALLPPLDDTSSEDLQSLQTLVPMGLRVALKEVYKRFRWSVPDEGDACLEAPQAQGPNGEVGGENGKPSPLTPHTSSVHPPGPKPTDDGQTQSAKTTDQTPIAPGADPTRNPGLAAPAGANYAETSSRQLPDTQVDAGAFWSRVGLVPRGADGQTLPMPSLGYAVPNNDTVGQSCCSAPISGRRSNAAPPPPRPLGATMRSEGGSTPDPVLLDRHANLVARGLGNSRAAQALQHEINRRRQSDNASLANTGFNPDEPRDSHGRWTTDSSSSATNHPTQTNMLAPEAARPFGKQSGQNAFRETPAKLGAFGSEPMTGNPPPTSAFTPKAFMLGAAKPPQSPSHQTATEPGGPAETPAKHGFFATIGTALQKAGEKVRDVVAAGEFLAVGDPQDALKQVGYSSDDLKRMGFKDVEEDSGTNGGKPFEQGMDMLPPVQHAIASGAEGIVVSSPKLAIAAVDPVAGAIAFGSTPEGFDPKQALIALVLPMVGKYSGEIVEGLATKFGVNSATALQLFKKLGGAAGITGALGLEQMREISKLPPEQQKQALIDAAGNLGTMFLTGMLGGEEKPGETGKPENIRANSGDTPREKTVGEAPSKPQAPEPPPTTKPLSAAERQSLEQDIQARKPISLETLSRANAGGGVNIPKGYEPDVPNDRLVYRGTDEPLVKIGTPEDPPQKQPIPAKSILGEQAPETKEIQQPTALQPSSHSNQEINVDPSTGNANVRKENAAPGPSEAAKSGPADTAKQQTIVGKKSKGSYVHRFESEKEYVGKGTVTRMKRSGRRLARKTGDKLKSSNFDPAIPNTDRQAFKDEARKIHEKGGVPNPNLYNKINSPGKKFREEDQQSGQQSSNII